MRLLSLLLTVPGTAFHELAHYLVCRLTGVAVHQVVLFRFGNPAGYVVHSAPRHFGSQLAITSGPLVANSLLAYALFLPVAGRVATLAGIARSGGLSALDFAITPTSIRPEWGDLLVTVVCLWLGLSAALHAFPSAGDAGALWTGAGAQIRRGNLLAVAGYPLAALMQLANLLKLVRLHWAYAAALLWLAFASYAPN